MKKICIAMPTTTAGGGVEEMGAALVNYFVRKGLDVTVLCLYRHPRREVDISAQAKVYSIGAPSRFKWAFCIWWLIAYTRFYRQHEFDVVLSRIPWHSFFVACSLRLSKSQPPLFVTVHNPIKRHLSGRASIIDFMSRAFIRLSVGRVDGFACVSEHVAENVREVIGNRTARVKALYNPVMDTTREHGSGTWTRRKVRRRLGVDDESVLIISIGRLSYQKGHDILLQTMTSLPRHFRLLVVGDGPEHRRLTDLAQTLAVETRVSFLGYRRDIGEVLVAADVFALASRWEGFGNVFVEALAHQLPVVTTTCPGGQVEVLQHGRFGYLVSPESPSELARAIQEASRNGPNKNTRWKDFTVDTIGQDYLRFMALD